MKFYLKFIITLLNSLFISPNYIWRFVSGLNCNVDLCGSVVTKCQLMQSCPCSLDDIVCHQKCLNCLSRLFPSCCSCVELCGTDYENVSIRKSLIGLFNGVPELFNTFVYDNDDELDNDNDNNDNDNDDATLWTIIKFPAYKNLKKILPNTLEQFDQIYNQVNCTVLYFTTCITHKVCAQNCESMGASSYRWFEDGCCECAGSYCLNYGLNENHCSACPPNHHLDDYIDDEHSKQDDGATAFAAAADNNDNDDEDDDDDDDDDDDNINIDDLDTLEFGEDGVNDISKNKDTDDNDNDNDNDSS